MYTPTMWLDEVVEHPYRYKESNADGGSIEHTPDPGEVLQEGTPQSADNFNKMEHGILEALSIGSENTRVLASVLTHLRGIEGEVHQITLENKQEYPFNDSDKTIQLNTKRNTKNYTIFAEVVSVSGGGRGVGDVEFSSKLENGFKVHFTGSAKSVTLNLYVRGGI